MALRAPHWPTRPGRGRRGGRRRAARVTCGAHLVMHGNALDHAPFDARDAAQTLSAARAPRARRENRAWTGDGRRTLAGPPRADDAPSSRPVGARV